MKQNQQNEWRKRHIEITLERLGITRKEYKRFLIVANKLHRCFEMYCNGYYGSESIYRGNKMINEYTEEQYEKDTQPLFKKAREIAKEKNLFIFFQTDPRGATIYLDTKEIPYNAYTNASCIY